MPNVHLHFMSLAKREAEQAALSGDGLPFGALVMKNGRPISVRHNESRKTGDSRAHSELLAIQSACRTLETANLSGCVLYTTCEPCPLCLRVCWSTNLDMVVYDAGFEDNHAQGTKLKFIPLTDRPFNDLDWSTQWKRSVLKRVSNDEASMLRIVTAKGRKSSV